MRYLPRTFVVFLIACTLTGCIVVNDQSDDNWRSEQKKNRDIINSLSIGMTYSRVLAELGTPDFSEAFLVDQDEYKILFYRTQHRRSDGDTSQDETTPLVFKAGQLVGWGRTLLASLEQ